MTDTTATSGMNSSALNNSLDVMALGATPSASRSGKGQNGSSASGAGGDGSWFQALANAWGESLNQEATKIQTMSDGIGGGNEEPSQIAQLSAESLRFSFLSQSENTSIGSVGQALQTMARKD